MVDFATVGSSVVIGIILVLLCVLVIVFFFEKNITEGSSNFILITAFFLVVITVAIPFLQINIETVMGIRDISNPLKESILASVWSTTIIFVAFLLITFLLLRMYPDQLMKFVTLFTFLSFFVSLLAITLSTLQNV